jgi:hypothetical protein
MSRIGVIVTVLAVFAGCSSSLGPAGSDTGRDGAPLGTDAGHDGPPLGTDAGRDGPPLGTDAGRDGAPLGSDAGRDGPPLGTDAGHDGPPLGKPYTCSGGPFSTGDGGEVQVTCVVGQSYCSSYQLQSVVPHPAVPSCQAVPSNCADNPTCACIHSNSGGLCSCKDYGGFVNVSCQMI